MSIERVMLHEVGAADVYAMATSREFQHRTCAAAGAHKLVPSGVTSTETVNWGAAQPDGSFTALVPIVGRKVEQLAAPIITGVIDAEEKTGRTWAAGSV